MQLIKTPAKSRRIAIVLGASFMDPPPASILRLRLGARARFDPIDIPK
jgi:hypothetical protein